MELGQNAGDLERMVDVLLPREAALPGVGRGGPQVGLLDQLAVFGGQVLGDPEQLGDCHRTVLPATSESLPTDSVANSEGRR